MTLRTRLEKVEKIKGGSDEQKVECIYLCAMDAECGTSDPRVAILLGSHLNDEVPRLPKESANAFQERVRAILQKPKPPTY